MNCGTVYSSKTSRSRKPGGCKTHLSRAKASSASVELSAAESIAWASTLSRINFSSCARHCNRDVRKFCISSSVQQQPITLWHYRATTNHVAALYSNNQSRCGIIQQQSIMLWQYTATTNDAVALYCNNQSHCGIIQQQPITLRHNTVTTNNNSNSYVTILHHCRHNAFVALAHLHYINVLNNNNNNQSTLYSNNQSSWDTISTIIPYCYDYYCPILYCLQCFDAVGWAAGRASGL